MEFVTERSTNKILLAYEGFKEVHTTSQNLYGLIRDFLVSEEYKEVLEVFMREESMRQFKYNSYVEKLRREGKRPGFGKLIIDGDKLK